MQLNPRERAATMAGRYTAAATSNRFTHERSNPVTPAEKTKFRIAHDPGTIQLSETQIDNYRVRPEFFQVRRYNDPIDQPFHGQSQNDAEAAKRSREEFNRGSIRAAGNVNHHGEPHSV